MKKSIKGKNLKAAAKEAAVSTDDPVEQELFRTGINCSVYLSKGAAELLGKLSKRTRRSRSLLISLLVEKHGPAVESDPAALGV